MNEKITEQELISFIDQAVSNSITEKGDFSTVNKDLFDNYMGLPFGDEMEGRSSVVSTDVADLVESDMTSLARVFLGAGEVIEFRPNNPTNPTDLQEAQEKNAYIPHIIRNAKDSFRTLHGFLKNIEIQKIGMLEYGIRKSKKVETKHYEGISEDELILVMDYLKKMDKVKSVKIISKESIYDSDQQVFNLEINLTYECEEFFLCNVPPEDAIISSNSESKDDAELIGKKFRKTRSQLIADGFDKNLVRSLPLSRSNTDSTTIKAERYRDEGAEEYKTPIQHWANEIIEGYDVYVSIDYDNDGIAERRHIVKCGKVILENEPFAHIPFAIASAMLMPHSLIGRCRAELAMVTQRVQSVLTRQILDNVYLVNNGRNLVNMNAKVNMDDLLTVRPNGIVRHSGSMPAQEAVFPLITPYIGDKALQVVQYMDSKRAQSTGSLMANQGLKEDALHKETATRFRGVEDAAAAKIELVARVIAETAWKDLYEGAAWFASHYQNDEQEIAVLGKALTVNPAGWKFDHSLDAVVGTGAGDDQKIMESISALLTVQEKLKMSGSVIVDEVKIYNLVKKLTRTLGIYNVADYFNDPAVPEQVVKAENEIMKQQLAAVQQQMQNPLAEAEQVKGQVALASQQAKQEFEMAKLMVQIRQDQQNLQEEQRQFNAEMLRKLTELELNARQNVPGALI